jgi:uncharacterized protein GlcG (DUF336 family)
VIGGIAASGATVSPFFPAGIPQENMIADGKPANPEDLLIHYALDVPYVGQHGDDYARWARSFGDFPAEAPAGLGMAPAPVASHQFEHDWAIGVADAVLAEAHRRKVLVALAVVDQRGDPIQQDAADGAPTAAAFLALSLAAAAATFQLPSHEIADRFGDQLASVIASLPYSILASRGGVPIRDGRTFVGGLGVAGAEPQLCEEIATAALESVS